MEELEEEEVGLCDEERALKPLVPAIVTVWDTTGEADFWAKSIPGGGADQDRTTNKQTKRA